MADEQKKKITDLPSASSVGDNDLFTIVQGGVATKTATTVKVGERINTAQAFSTLTTTSKNIVGAINELKEGSISGDASDISYDNTTSGLTADDVQEAIDELAQGGGGATSLDQLSDVSITSGTLADGQFFVYDNDDSGWINKEVIHEPITQAQYDAMVSGGTVDPDVYYPITDSGILTFTDVTGTLTAGQTSITLSDNAITTSSTIEVFNDLDIPYNSKTLSTGSITLTFDAQASNMSVKVRVS